MSLWRMAPICLDFEKVRERLPPMTPRETFIRDMRRDPRLAGHAVKLARALEAIDHEGDDVPDAKAFFSSIGGGIARPATLDKRLEGVNRLLAPRKPEKLKN